MSATGEAFLSCAKLDSRLGSAWAVGNIRTTEAHVARAWQMQKSSQFEGRV